MTLLPEVEVRAQVRCDALTSRSRQIFPACAEVHLGRKRVSATCNETGTFQIALPPGKYTLNFDTHLHRTEWTNMPLVVTAQAEPLDLGYIELTAAKVELLIGELAPEIPDVVAWKNSPPLNFSDLRGRVVLLDFWGEWCGSCVVDMPKMFALHDKYRDQGLSIVGIHVDKAEDPAARLDTVAKLDDRLAVVRHGEWKDRDIPFPVALMVGDRAKYGAGISGLPRSAEHAAYGVTMFPTQVLIDRRGNVAQVFVGGISWHDDGLTALEMALAEK